MCILVEWWRTVAQCLPSSLYTHWNLKLGLHNLTACHLLEGCVILWLWRNSMWTENSFLFLACQTSVISRHSALNHTDLFFHSHRWQRRVGLWRWDPLTLQWKPVRLSFIVGGLPKRTFTSTPSLSTMWFMWHTAHVIIFCLIISFSSFPQQTASMPEMCEYILCRVLLKWEQRMVPPPLPLMCIFTMLFPYSLSPWQHADITAPSILWVMPSWRTYTHSKSQVLKTGTFRLFPKSSDIYLISGLCTQIFLHGAKKNI